VAAEARNQMRNYFETWTRNLWIWLLPLIVLALNLLLWGVYETSFESRRESLESISARAGARLERLQEQSREMELFLSQVDQQKQAIAAIYTDHFATEAERFTALLREVRGLARQAGLQPDSFNYPKLMIDGEGLIRRSVSFSVTGTYEQVRRLINFFELSDQFITLEDIELSGGDAGTDRLGIRLSFSTLFVATDEDQKLAAAQRAIDQRNRDQAAAEAAAAEAAEAGGENPEEEVK
jgi:Tfp pilus assembly protein PilO